MEHYAAEDRWGKFIIDMELVPRYSLVKKKQKKKTSFRVCRTL